MHLLECMSYGSSLCVCYNMAFHTSKYCFWFGPYSWSSRKMPWHFPLLTFVGVGKDLEVLHTSYLMVLSHTKAMDQIAKGILWLADSQLPSFFNYFCGQMGSLMSHSQPDRRIWPCLMTKLVLSVYY